MKTVLALFTVLVLAGAQLVAIGQPPAAEVRATVCDCHKACCSVAQSEGQPAAPAVPAISNSQSPLLSLPPASLAWMLPAATAGDSSFSEVLPLTAGGTPLYARNCVRLI